MRDDIEACLQGDLNERSIKQDCVVRLATFSRFASGM